MGSADNYDASKGEQMKTTETLLVTASIWAAIIVSAPEVAGAYKTDTLELGINTGVRKDRLDWTIAGNLAGSNPNILSELTWDDLDIFQVGVGGRLITGIDRHAGFYLRGHVNYGWILDGHGRDSDYRRDNRNDEFSRSSFATSDDDVFDASIGAGVQWRYRQQRVLLALLGGLSYHEQNLRMTDGVQIVDRISPSPELGPFPEWLQLNSTYAAQWLGPWAGLDVELHLPPRCSVLGSLEYHWASYRAKADWNLRPEFAHPVSFRHEADTAAAIVVTVAGRYLFTRNWALDLTLAYQRWRAKNGIDLTFFADGGTGATKLNEVNWRSHAATAGVSYIF
jgi:hypothetical protein